ncbi:hypothetical protein [Falsiroseomonas sp. HW251]|uniref:hypothetical protein n=1 Tax=Falsiroseomonas sp. HW251 TaxID=3390998 RepID=UPI003D3171C0
MLACVGLAAALKPAAAQGRVALRDLYDETGEAPSALARRLDGKRVALEGLVAPVPSGAAGWLALGETALVPCQLCGGAHDWPTGVVSVRGELPHIADPYSRVTIEGVLVLDPAAREGTGLPERLVLRDAGLASA